ncbi:hypothetical protein [Halarcobacter sp.]|uniref:hypothetical protein n=1 Tax=Halarcobacter sp. TaxID=2321133 RepID=UPI002AAB4236|nr:hypothetical protein [Halarcobacter sp.]
MVNKGFKIKIFWSIAAIIILVYLIARDFTYSKNDFIKAKNVIIASKQSIKKAKCSFVEEETIFILIKRKYKPTVNDKISDSVRVIALKYGANTILIKGYKILLNPSISRQLWQIMLKVEIYKCKENPKAAIGALFYGKQKL